MFPSHHTSYDEVPYASYPLPQTHPDHLATIATLLGLNPAPTDHCRVLELGCASGGNLLPMALALPESQFLGIDLSRQQITEGQQTITALGLRNIELRHLSILDVDDRFGQFDYILCHGVYSWVPERVQDKILDICARHLPSNGIGYVSYNTYPGWYMRGMIRDMMCYHVSRFRDQPALERVARARALLAFLARSVPQPDSPHGLLLRRELEVLGQQSDSYLFHEHLEDCNDPVYFLDFCERLARRGLRYLGEAEFHSMVAGTAFAQEVQQELHELAPNLLEREQYMDFLRNRTFRQTLVCHGHLQPCYDVRAEQLAGFHIASPLCPTSSAPDLAAPTPEQFRNPAELTLTTTTPVVKQALAYLGEAWPQAVAFDALAATACARLASAPAPGTDAAQHEIQLLARALLSAYATAGRALVELSLRTPAFVVTVGERPRASPLARLQAARNLPITNLRHETVTVSPFDRHLLPFLDGTRDHAALVEALVERLEQGGLTLTRDEQPVTDPLQARPVLVQVLEQQLPKLARAALLLA